jgi:hypothetical protein
MKLRVVFKRPAQTFIAGEGIYIKGGIRRRRGYFDCVYVTATHVHPCGVSIVFGAKLDRLAGSLTQE